MNYPRSLKMLGGMALVLTVTCLAIPAVMQGHGIDDLLAFISSTGWTGDLNSPLLDSFTSTAFGNGREGFLALLQHLGPECGFTVPEPCTMLLTGLFAS